MPVTIEIPTAFRRFTEGAPRVDCSGTTIAEALNELTSRFPALSRHVRDERRVPVGHACDQGPQADPRRPRGDAGKNGIALEHGVGSRTEVGKLIEVVHHEDGVEA